MREADEHRWSALMVSAQAGNESDYQQLLSELLTLIQRFLRSRFGSHPFIEDCVQEALIAVHQARHTYDPKRRFRPWLFAIVRNKAIDVLRQQGTQQKTVESFRQTQEVVCQTGEQGSIECEISEGELLQSLSEAHREVLVLTKVIGFSVAETAKRLDISEGAVKVRVHRAIHKLRQLLEQEEL